VSRSVIRWRVEVRPVRVETTCCTQPLRTSWRKHWLLSRSSIQTVKASILLADDWGYDHADAFHTHHHSHG